MSKTENKQLIPVPAEKLVDALLHARQFEQHYATQDSVNNLKEQLTSRFDQINTKLTATLELFSRYTVIIL